MKLNYKLCIMVMYGKVDDVVLVSMTVKVTIELIISTVYVDCLLHPHDTSSGYNIRNIDFELTYT